MQTMVFVEIEGGREVVEARSKPSSQLDMVFLTPTPGLPGEGVWLLCCSYRPGSLRDCKVPELEHGVVLKQVR